MRCMKLDHIMGICWTITFKITSLCVCFWLKYISFIARSWYYYSIYNGITAFKRISWGILLLSGKTSEHIREFKTKLCLSMPPNFSTYYSYSCIYHSDDWDQVSILCLSLSLSLVNRISPASSPKHMELQELS